ncbi:MAG: CocE/NonD family hydrolase [Saprospiraceae bacterium]|nr:CocE/NonD family hydrolase [Saprospiraceae bacterium]
MRDLAVAYLGQSYLFANEIPSDDRFRLEILAGFYKSAIKTIQSLRAQGEDNAKHQKYIQYEIYALSKMHQAKAGKTFDQAYENTLKKYLRNCDSEKAYSSDLIFTTYDGVQEFKQRFIENYNHTSEYFLTPEKSLNLLKDYFLYHLYTITEPIFLRQIEIDNRRRYVIEEKIIPTKDGGEISAIIARKKNKASMSAILVFTIYADASNTRDALLAASKGYVGVVATSRGKRLSRSKIEPYKYENEDVYTVIDWVSTQSWSNKKVVMYGGSYNGFTQWASMKKKVHPALKTIVTSVSAAPGIDVPMENNIFLNFPYSWIPYVTNNKFLDNDTYFDRDKWTNLEENWFRSGRPYCKMDSIEGLKNIVFQEWIRHPAYDEYWQKMIPYKGEFSHIHIPILSTTGYYDDGQRGAMYYYLEHLKYYPQAEHYLVIGPYDHWGAQFAASSYLRGYKIDEVANLNIKNELVFAWFDYILKGKDKPAILKDKVNLQVMGTNKWMNVPTLHEISNDSVVYHLTTKNSSIGTFSLSEEQPKQSASINLSLDLTDRAISNNADYYPDPIIKDRINLRDGLIFISEPLETEMIINGSFSGNLKITTNKKDFDFGVILYELTPEGKYFHLSYYIGRASYAQDREKREMITPGQLTDIPFNNTRLISKKIAKGSRIVVIINGNKNAYSQINYGTGKDVSLESVSDAEAPLELNLEVTSEIIIPIWKHK